MTTCADMQKRATHATQGRGNFLIIAEISSTNPTKWLFSIKTRPFYAKKNEIECIVSILEGKPIIYWCNMSKLLIFCQIFCGHY